MEEQPKSIPNCLRKYRKAKGLQQKEVARILGFKSASIVSRWENGTCLPSVTNAFKLAVVYRVMVDALFIDMRGAISREMRTREEKFLTPKV